MSVILQKDYKNYKCKSAKGEELIFGAASIDIKLKEFLLHFGASILIKEFKLIIKMKHLKYLIVLGRSRKKSGLRDFLIFTEDVEYLQKWSELFNKMYTGELGLEHMKGFDDFPQCQYYSYKNLIYTRKKLEPLWRDISSQIKSLYLITFAYCI